MYFYLPVALTSINSLMTVAVGFMVGILTGIFGVGGGWLITPLLMMMGISPTVSVATGANQMVASATSGAYAHYRLGNVDFKMGWCLLGGSFFGGFLGAEILKVLRSVGNAGFVIKLTYVLLLGIVGVYMLTETLSKMKAGGMHKERKETGLQRFLNNLPMQTYFEKSGVTHSLLVPISLGVIVGILAGIMGVGGGFLMIPVMIYMLRMPVHVTVGTSLFIILFTSMEVTFLQAYTNHAVDFILAVLLLLGSTIGTQVGVFFGKRLKGEHLKLYLALILLIVAVQMILNLVLTPSILLSSGGR
ncbi:MAG: sulfite exporter TauE/SafE family protein [Thermodesulfovibrionales bacterium]